MIYQALSDFRWGRRSESSFRMADVSPNPRLSFLQQRFIEGCVTFKIFYPRNGLGCIHVLVQEVNTELPAPCDRRHVRRL